MLVTAHHWAGRCQLPLAPSHLGPRWDLSAWDPPWDLLPSGPQVVLTWLVVGATKSLDLDDSPGDADGRQPYGLLKSLLGTLTFSGVVIQKGNINENFYDSFP